MPVGSTLGPEEVVPAGGPEQPGAEPAPMPDVLGEWWRQYRSAIAERMSDQALEVIELDARFIVERALPQTDDAMDVSAWENGGVRTGMVVGSVQSGKTASMLAVAALALDQKVDMVILLAGTRVGLWLQTYERLLGQLDGSTKATAFRRRSERLILPVPDDVLNAERADAGRYLQRPVARQALRSGRPIICVVPKEDDHLLKLRKFLVDIVTDDFLSARDKPFTMLLLDDEADDASVLDSEGSQKVTPRLITALWSGDPDVPTTRHPNLLATYVAYTATPQANYLQSSHNPLTPRHFHVALRTPGASGNALPRTLTYLEPKGISGYYCGGEIFYERLRGMGTAALCQGAAFPEMKPGETEAELAAQHVNIRQRMLADALRSFLVGAAVRLHHAQNGRSYDRSFVFPDAAAARLASPPAHTMLVHPSARKEDHLQTALDIVRWSMSFPDGDPDVRVPGEDIGQPELLLSPEGLTRRLEAEEAEWSAWLPRFEATRLALAALPGAPYKPVAAHDWPDIRERLIQEVFPAVALRVLNSDPASDERPRFDPEAAEDGFRIAPDLLSIFVAGNVLSRGLTLEGLATSLFLRGAAEPAADTQMQMQRWFGYRGAHLPFCRLMAFDDQIGLFERYHVNDNALKAEIMARMDGNDAGPSAALVLQGADFLATSKVESRKVPLSPGPRPSVRLVETQDPMLAQANIDIVAAALKKGAWEPLVDDNGLQRGLIKDEPIGLLDLADLLDQFRYSHHDPDPASELSRRWTHYQALLGLDAPLMRAPGLNPQRYACEPQSCPYSIAAYLRLWHALREDRHGLGFYPTDRPEVPWSLADSASIDPPSFYLAVRNGERAAGDKRLARAGVKAMTRQLTDNAKSVQTLWGTRGYVGAYLGDELVDYYHHRASPVPSIQGGATWRPRGHPGLVLLHVVGHPAYATDLVGVGLGLPHGGPDHIAALRI